MLRAEAIAILVGILQGIFEWLPISSEGNIAIVLTAVGVAPTAAVSFALFLHAGTALSATVYYRAELHQAVQSLADLNPQSPFAAQTAVLSFLVVATVASGITGLSAYLFLEAIISAFTGGVFIVLVGCLLVVTGLFQRSADGLDVEARTPTLVDAVIIGVLQGLAILPGISRSGTTTSALLLRGFDGESAFRLSFLLSIPAALGGGLLGYLDYAGSIELTVSAAGLALATAAIVGYLTIDVLMRLVRRIAFWAVCVSCSGAGRFSADSWCCDDDTIDPPLVARRVGGHISRRGSGAGLGSVSVPLSMAPGAREFQGT